MVRVCGEGGWQGCVGVGKDTQPSCHHRRRVSGYPIWELSGRRREEVGERGGMEMGWCQARDVRRD